MTRNLISIIVCSLLMTMVMAQTTLERSFNHDDSQRSYLLYVPADYDGTEDWPLVINYHGFTNTAYDQLGVSQMNPVADTAHFLIAYPQGLMVNNPFLGFSATGWNADGTLSNTDDVDFSRKLIEHIQSDYRIAGNRIHVTGWSMSAVMAFQVSCEMTDVVASCAAVASQMVNIQLNQCDPGRPFSILEMHGTEDPIVPFNGDGSILSAALRTPAFWATNNNCSSEYLTINLPDLTQTDSSTVTLLEYQQCNQETEVIFYRINGGGHTWPGGGELSDFLGNINRDIHASIEIWNFFKRNTLSSSTAIRDIPDMMNLRIYPVPTEESLTIEFALETEKNIQMDLYNTVGQKVSILLPYQRLIGPQKIQVNILDVSDGLNYLHCQIGTVHHTYPILLQKKQ